MSQTHGDILAVVLGKDLFSHVRERADATNTDSAQFVRELIECDRAEWVLLRRPPSPSLAESREMRRKAPRTNSRYMHRSIALSPEQVQQLLHLHHSGNLTQAQLAERFRCSESTVRRILDGYRFREHVSTLSGTPANRGKGQEIQRRMGLS